MTGTWYVLICKAKHSWPVYSSGCNYGGNHPLIRWDWRAQSLGRTQPQSSGVAAQALSAASAILSSHTQPPVERQTVPERSEYCTNLKIVHACILSIFLIFLFQRRLEYSWTCLKPFPLVDTLSYTHMLYKHCNNIKKIIPAS